MLLPFFFSKQKTVYVKCALKMHQNAFDSNDPLVLAEGAYSAPQTSQNPLIGLQEYPLSIPHFPTSQSFFYNPSRALANVCDFQKWETISLAECDSRQFSVEIYFICQTRSVSQSCERTRLVSWMSIIKLCTNCSLRVNSSLCARTATTRAVQNEP